MSIFNYDPLSAKTHPFLGHIPRDDKLKSSGYRVLVIESYLAFYIVRGKTVEIHRVVHGSRSLDDII
ncbi:type II toxin-antitoxin system RelE/ParE family toxin [Patescibacteria group bacterium]|nr:type II toxin-antitoxin system RelE/ParE family toxin [Patescibacteria group bacterium]